jgi:predicted secreted protein
MDIIIETLIPDETTTPVEGVDTLGHYIEWEVGTIYTFELKVPQGYQIGDEISVVFDEATAGESLNHQWQLTATLNGTDQVIVTEEFASAAAADTRTERVIQISTDGAIDGTDIAVGDLLYVEWERIAASASEDGNPIRLYVVLVRIAADDESGSGCLGDVGAIIDEIRDLINDANAKHISNTQLIRAMNAGLRHVAKRHYWKKESSLNITGGTGSIVVGSQVSDFRKAFSLRYASGDTTQLLKQCTSWEDFQERVRENTSAGTPEYWICVSNTIYFSQVPAASETGTLILLHSYNPTALGCSTGYTVPFPGADYDALVYWCVWWTHGRFYSDNRMEEMAFWWKMFADALEDLISQGYGEMAFRPT